MNDTSGAVFVTTGVLAIVSMVGDIKVARRPFVRDIVMFLLVRHSRLMPPELDIHPSARC